MTQKQKRSIRKPEGFENVQGYFMIANQDAATAIVNKLTGSQLRLWLYLMMVDSFADTTADGEKIYHKIPSPAEIAIKTGASAERVEKDMRKLKKLGLYEYRITGWQGHNSSAAKAKQESQRLKHKKKPQRQAQQALGVNIARSLNSPLSEENEPQTHTQQELGLNSPQERLNSPQEGLNSPQERLNSPQEGGKSIEKPGASESFQIYTDLINTFSEAERERFLDFCRRQSNNLPIPVTMLRSWIGKHSQELLEMYKDATGQTESKKKEECSAAENLSDSERELIREALESGEIEAYDKTFKMVKYPGDKWWTELEDFFNTKREQPREEDVPEPKEAAPETEETAKQQAQEEFYIPDLKLKTISRSTQRIIDEAFKNGEIEAYDQVNGTVKVKGNRWWTYIDEFIAEREKWNN